MKPTPAEMLNGMPRMPSASTPPMAASGMPVKISSASFTERKARNSSMKIRSSDTGTATARRALAWFRFSNWPPYTML